MPNQCSSSNTFVYYTCMVLLHLHCPSGALPPLAGLRSLSCCLQFLLIPHGSSCGFHATLFISSSVSLHFTSFAACRLLQGWVPPSKHQSQYTGGSPAFTQVTPTILTGFHSASLRHPFTSVAFSPPAAHNLARRPPHFGCVHLASANCSCRTSISQSIAKVHLHSSSRAVGFAKFTARDSYGAGIVATP